ncbi:hypothetical protein [Pseudogracilibacillus sp. SO30301A]|uniref:hypothetical protein n=1 Tax=Pseudogracilibacillus sp. SO30301A TaxID=3098291 RepID=UPI00300E5BA4
MFKNINPLLIGVFSEKRVLPEKVVYYIDVDFFALLGILVMWINNHSSKTTRIIASIRLDFILFA